MILEVWSLSCNKQLLDKTSRVSHSIYNRMGTLLKSLVQVTRATPAYKLSRKKSMGCFDIFYRIYSGNPQIDNLGKQKVALDSANWIVIVSCSLRLTIVKWFCFDGGQQYSQCVLFIFCLKVKDLRSILSVIWAQVLDNWKWPLHTEPKWPFHQHKPAGTQRWCWKVIISTILARRHKFDITLKNRKFPAHTFKYSIIRNSEEKKFIRVFSYRFSERRE